MGPGVLSRCSSGLNVTVVVTSENMVESGLPAGNWDDAVRNRLCDVFCMSQMTKTTESDIPDQTTTEGCDREP